MVAGNTIFCGGVPVTTMLLSQNLLNITSDKSVENSQSKSAIDDLLDSFLSNKSLRTIEAYRKDLNDFRRFLDVPTIDEASKMLLSGGLGPANALVLKYKKHLIQRNLSPATQNRRLSAIRSLVEMAGTLGIVNWQLKIRRTKNDRYRRHGGSRA